MSYRSPDGGTDGAHVAEARHHRAQTWWLWVRRPAALTVLSTVLPGLGLVFTRSRPVGLGILAIFVLTGGLTFWYVHSHGVLDAVAGSVTNRRLDALMWVLGICALLWIGAIVLTAVSSCPRPGTRASTTTIGVVALVMSMLVAVPAVRAISDVGITRDVLSTVVHRPYLPERQPTSRAKHSAAPTAPANGVNPWKGIPRVNLLLIGSDGDSLRIGVRTDS